MPKEEVKRYSISIIEKTSSRIIKTQNELNELLDNIEKYNSKDTNLYFIGNIEVDRLNGIVTFIQYKKVSVRTTLENIDNATINFKNDFELKTHYNVDYKNRHPLIITYRANKQIRSLPIIYKPREKYLDKSYVRKKYLEYALDKKFLDKILNNKQIEASFTSNLDNFDILYRLREELKYGVPSFINLAPMCTFYDNCIYRNSKFNYFNFRLLAILLKEYEKELEQEETKANEIDNQITVEEYLRDTYTKKLLPKHKTTK